MNSIDRWQGLGLASLLALGAVTPTASVASEKPHVEPARIEGDGPAVKAEGDFPGNLDEALNLIYAGKGGEGGIGLTKLWPRISAPALSGEQVRRTLIGNTIRQQDVLAIYFNPDGTLESWFNEWTEQDAAKCPAGKKHVAGDGWSMRDGRCFARTIVPVTGTWKIKNHQVCPVLIWDGSRTENFKSGKNDTCWYVALILDQVVLFDTDGEIQGRGKELKRGRQLGQVVE